MPASRGGITPDARRPQALAARRRTPPLEGLTWLGRAPTADAGMAYRLALALVEGALFGLCRIRLRVSGRARLPAGGYLLAAAVHRSWIDPLVILRACPREPRPWFLASGPSLLGTGWRERLFRWLGGALPVWRGGADVAPHVASARAVIAAGCPFVVLVEGAVAGPPDRLAKVRGGVGLLALRTGAPIVPTAISGTDELYRGKRVRARFLAPVTLADLLGPGWDGVLPAPGTRDELRMARRVTAALVARLGGAVAELYPATVDPPGTAKRWTRLGRLFL